MLNYHVFYHKTNMEQNILYPEFQSTYTMEATNLFLNKACLELACREVQQLLTLPNQATSACSVRKFKTFMKNAVSSG